MAFAECISQEDAVRVKIEKIVDFVRQRAEARRLAAEVEQSQAAERAARKRFRVERTVLYGTAPRRGEGRCPRLAMRSA